MSELSNDQIVRQFHDLYRVQYNNEGPPLASWFGFNCSKCPLDLWIYQEIIADLKPAMIIEGGTAAGGSALFLAHMLDIVNYGRVLTIDWEDVSKRPEHPRIKQIIGNTLDDKTFQSVKALSLGSYPKLLILDDGHDQTHVFNELLLYGSLLQSGDYLIVEDTNLGGPLWGLDKYLEKYPNRFQRDPDKERFLMTFNPKGYLRCVA